MRLRTKVYCSMNSYTTFVHLGPYMLVCACVYNILSHTMSLFLWWRLENSLDIWFISLVVMAWVSLILKVSSKWGMSQICWLLKNLDLTCCILCLVENSGEKSYMLNFYLPLALTCLPLFPAFGKRRNIRREGKGKRLIWRFKGVKGRHIRFFNFYCVVCARIV